MPRRIQYQETAPGWMHHASEDVKASRMTWYTPQRDVLHRRPARRAAVYEPCSVRPLDWSPPAPTVAQLMSWFTPVSQPRIVRTMGKHLTISYPAPLQPHYGGALIAGIEMKNSIGNKRIEASGTVVVGRGIGTIP